MPIERITNNLLSILSCLIEADKRNEQIHGWQIRERTGISGPSIYKTMDRLVEELWVTDEVELLEPHIRRPRRRYFRMTHAGRVNGAALLAMRRPGE